MRKYCFFFLITALAFVDSNVQAQSKVDLPSISWSPKQLNAYFKIDGRFVEYQGKQYASVHPMLREPPKDNVASFMQSYRRRFEYILQNKTEFNDLANSYPDTIRVNQAYAQRLAVNKPFLSYLSQLLEPLNRPDSARQTIFKENELMLVASRFFLCDQVRPDTTVSWHVCIGLNGMKEADWTRDYTLLEAFCFEAIFDKMSSKDSDENRYMYQFLRAVDESTKKHKPSMRDKEQLLERVKMDVFQTMQLDPILKKHLINYYNQHAATLPFTIVSS